MPNVSLQIFRECSAHLIFPLDPNKEARIVTISILRRLELPRGRVTSRETSTSARNHGEIAGRDGRDRYFRSTYRAIDEKTTRLKYGGDTKDVFIVRDLIFKIVLNVSSDAGQIVFIATENLNFKRS